MPDLSPDKQQGIDSLVENLKLRTGLVFPGDNLLDLARLEGVTVIEADLTTLKQGISGIITYDEPTEKTAPRVFLDQGLPRNRKSFTLAHELGHHFLHDGTKLRVDDLDYSLEGSLEETEANYFAASLLIPEELLTYRLGLDDRISELAEYFNVSEAAIRARIRWITSKKKIAMR